jgi:hypothetical protein
MNSMMACIRRPGRKIPFTPISLSFGTSHIRIIPNHHQDVIEPLFLEERHHRGTMLM